MTSSHDQFKRVPQSTYRVQLTPRFGFADAAQIVPYLSKLGISDLYCSPIMTARSGSTHGYDVVDPQHLNPELGGQQAFDQLLAALRSHKMGLLLDIVPNHMAASSDNPWWLDVLENGPSSRYADFFDIEWDPVGPGGLENRVLLPVLGSPYGEALENGEIQIVPDQLGYHLQYFDLELPLATTSYSVILGLNAKDIEQELSADDADWRAYSGLLEATASVPLRTSSDPELIELRDAVRRQLDKTLPRLRRNEIIRTILEQTIAQINGKPGDPRSFDLLDRLVASQAYRLAFWQLAHEQINYRRFFDINDLVSMRVEDPQVFDAVHQRIIRLVTSGAVSGLRIDHVDGLWDPQGYLTRLQQSIADSPSTSEQCYVVVEKILSQDETLPQDWPVAGTTGYDFLNILNALAIDESHVEELDRLYRQITDVNSDFRELVYQAKVRMLDTSFAANIQSLSVMLGQIADQDRHGRDLTFESLRQAVIEVTAALPVYRTYTRSFEVSEQDRRWIDSAIETSMNRVPDLRHTLAFLRRVLLMRIPPYVPESERGAWLQFVMRWQQVTGPAMAKGSEDTALYQYNRLLSLNDVGGEPESRGMSIDEFHAFNLSVLKHWPHTLNASSTHDTKRSEDVRARIAVLSEIPDAWANAVVRWREINAGKRPVRNGFPIPDSNVELQIYQTMLGAWPNDSEGVDAFRDRLKAYLIKAAREAKIYTSWTESDSVYEDALMEFVDAIFEEPHSSDFLRDFGDFERLVSCSGAVNSLSQTLIKLTAPGVPDTYQGTELWDYSLVDPDNRRTVDYAVRQRLLDRLPAAESVSERSIAELVDRWHDGRAKLLLHQRVLQLRNRHADLFARGTYAPCPVLGHLSRHVVAFTRTLDDLTVITIVPRLVSKLVKDSTSLSLADVWGDTAVIVPDQVGRSTVDVITGSTVSAGDFPTERRLLVNDVLRQFPCGLLLTRK